MQGGEVVMPDELISLGVSAKGAQPAGLGLDSVLGLGCLRKAPSLQE